MAVSLSRDEQASAMDPTTLRGESEHGGVRGREHRDIAFTPSQGDGRGKGRIGADRDMEKGGDEGKRAGKGWREQRAGVRLSTSGRPLTKMRPSRSCRYSSVYTPFHVGLG